MQWRLLDYPEMGGLFATDTSNSNAFGKKNSGIVDISGDLWERIVSFGDLAGFLVFNVE